MLGIDSSIVEHEIKMYLDVKPVQQRLRHVHPKKVVAIKAKVNFFFMLVSYTLFLLPIGFQIQSMWIKSKEQSKYASNLET